MLIKVCGMREPDNIREVAALQPDMMGFIFYPGSPRYAGGMDPRVMDVLPEHIRRVGVFVNERYDCILSSVERYCMDSVQLHGKETPELCHRLREQGLKVIKAIGIGNREDFREACKYAECCDWLLFDTLSSQYGGTGYGFDWEILGEYQEKSPFLLSGGIGPDSTEAIRKIGHPCFVGIDLNSRFETSPAQKDLSLLTGFLEQLNV